MSPQPFDVRWLGRVPFAVTVKLQEHLRAEILAGHGRETLLLCEHEPVITLGRSARPEHVLLPQEELDRRGISVVKTSRGGDVTYHGPGQLVGYPIFRLRRGILDHLKRMAAALIAVLAAHGVRARFLREAPGLWVPDAQDQRHAIEDMGLSGWGAKVCAFGVHVHRRVSIHGFALNLSTPLEAFSAIVPCGLACARVTSVAALTGLALQPGALVDEVGGAFLRAYAPDNAPTVSPIDGLVSARACAESSASLQEGIASDTAAAVSSSTT